MKPFFKVESFDKTEKSEKRIRVQIQKGKNKFSFFLKQHEARYFIELIDNNITI